MQNSTLLGRSGMVMQTSPVLRGKKGTLHATWMFFCFLLLSVTFIGLDGLQAQSIKPDPGMYPFCPNCNSKDIKTSKITYLPESEGSCTEPNSTTLGRFQFDLDVTANTRYGLLIYFDIYTANDVFVGTFFDCMTVDLPKGPNPIVRNSTEYKLYLDPAFSTLPPGSLKAKNVFTAWDNRIPDQVCQFSSFNQLTGKMTILDCQKVAPKCKTYESVPLFNLYDRPTLTLTATELYACDASSMANLEFTELLGGDLYSLVIDGVIKADGQPISTSPLAIDISSYGVGVYPATIVIKSSVTGCESEPYHFNLNIGDVVKIQTQPASKVECQGDENATVQLSVGASGEMLTYQWYSRSSSNGVVTPITDATASTYMAPISADGTMYYYVVVKGLCGTDQTSSQVSVLVNKATKINVQPVDKEVCKGGDGETVGLSVSADGTGIKYQWYVSETADGEGVAILNATTSAFAAPISTDGEKFYYVFVDGECGDDVKSDVISVKVNKPTSINTQPLGDEVCKGEEGSHFDLSVSAEGTGLTYQWYSRTSTDVSVSPILNATSSVFEAPISASGTVYYSVKVMGSCGSDVWSDEVTVIVKKNTSIVTEPAAKEVCEDAAAQLSVSADGENIHYQWYHTSSQTDEGIAIVDATNSSYEASTSSAGVNYYYVLVHGDCGDDQKSEVVSVTVKPITEIVTSPSDETTCLDKAVTLSVTASGVDLKYQWFSMQSSNGSASEIIDATSSSYTAPVSSVGYTYYYVVVSGGCGDATSGVAEVHVKEALSISTQPKDEVVCIGGNAGALSVVALNATGYQWYKSSDNQIGNGDDVMIDGATGSTYSPIIEALTMYYYVVVSGDCEDVTSDIAEVQVVECGSFCTYSQGGFGSPTGSTRYSNGESCENETTLKAIQHAISSWSGSIITLGGANASLTIEYNDAASVINYLPAGGSATGLPLGNNSLNYFISNKIQNSLLAQTITLALNIGLNMENNMMNYPLQAKYLMLDKAVNCGIDGTSGDSKCANFTIIAGLQDQDGVAGLTINDVWIAANKLLNDPTASVGISLGQVSSVVEAINLAWDECRIAKQWVSSCGEPVMQTSSLDAGVTSRAYPNPFRESFTIDFVSKYSGTAKVEIYDVTGRLIEVIYKGDVIAGVQYKVKYQSKLNTPSAVIYKVTVGQSTMIGRMLSPR